MGALKVFEVLECGGTGGTGHQVAAICNGLDPARFDVSLVYAVRPESTPGEYQALAKGAKRFVHVPEMVREITPVSDLKAFLRLYRLFKDERPDVVHAHSSKAGFLARAAAKAAGVPKVYYSPRGYSFLQTDRSMLSRAFYRLLERSVSWIGEVVAVSDSEGALAREKAGARKVRVVQDAFLRDLPAGEPRLNGDRGKDVVVCALGRLSYPRHPEAFIRLSQRLSDSRNGLRCLWIGGGELEPAVREMIGDMNLQNRLEVTGWLEHEKALERLKAADIFIHFSRWEGLPNAVLEAMAHGLPVIASDVPGNRDLVRHGENGYLAKTEVELLERALELVDKPDLRRAMGRKGWELMRSHYTRERMIRELSELYSQPA